MKPLLIFAPHPHVNRKYQYQTLLTPGAHKRHEVAQRSIKLTWNAGSNCYQTLLCPFFHFRIVLITEAIVRLQNKWLSTLGSLKMM